MGRSSFSIRITEHLSRLRRLIFAEPSGYLWGVLINVVCATIAYLVAPRTRVEHLLIIYLFGAVLISTRFGFAVSAFTAVTSALAFDYFCIAPRFELTLLDTHGVITFAGMLITALILCYLNHRLRQQWAAARASEARTLALCALSLELSDVAIGGDLPAAAERHLAALFGTETKVLLKGPEGRIDLHRVSREEQALAIQALERGEPTTDTTVVSRVRFQPIGRHPETLGLIRLSEDQNQFARTHDQVLLAACADRIAVALERISLHESARRANVEAEAERSRNALLSAVSHDLKTPLSSILTAGTTLLGREPQDSPDRDLLETIVEETERMNTLVTNLLNVTRLESGRVLLNKVPEALDDLIFSVLSRLSGRLGERAVTVEVPDDLPFVVVDSVLIDHVLANLLENVLRYTPGGSPIEIAVQANAAEVLLEVRDRGPGISPEERERVFDKFYRGKHAGLNDGGTGLGLTICRAVARAHGGWIRIKERVGGGAMVELALPRSDQQSFAQNAAVQAESTATESGWVA